MLRQDILWAKSSPMPESVKNRCTKSHEYIFLLTKGPRYYYDAEAIKEKALSAPSLTKRSSRDGGGHSSIQLSGRGDLYNGNVSNKRSVWSVDDHQALLQWLATNHPEMLDEYLDSSANRKDTWRISSQGYPGAHFATFPANLIRPCVLAGTSEHGACGKCGAPWRRVIETKQLTRERPNEYVKRTGEAGTGNSCANTVAGVEAKTTGWEPSCYCWIDKDRSCKTCGTSWKVYRVVVGRDWNAAKRRAGQEMVSGSHRNGREDDEDRLLASSSSTVTQRKMPCECFTGEVVPCTVLDPFLGSGTTCALSVGLGRRSVGIDLSESYLLYNAIPRVEGELLNRKGLSHLVGRLREAISIGERV